MFGFYREFYLSIFYIISWFVLYVVLPQPSYQGPSKIIEITEEDLVNIQINRKTKLFDNKSDIEDDGKGEKGKKKKEDLDEEDEDEYEYEYEDQDGKQGASQSNKSKKKKKKNKIEEEEGISQSRENRACQQVEDEGQEYSEFGRAPIGKEEENEEYWIIFCYVPWSNVCINFESTVAETSLKYTKTNIHFAKINLEKYLAIADEYNISLSPSSFDLPTLLLLKNGRLISRLPQDPELIINQNDQMKQLKSPLIKNIKVTWDRLSWNRDMKSIIETFKLESIYNNNNNNNGDDKKKK